MALCGLTQNYAQTSTCFSDSLCINRDETKLPTLNTMNLAMISPAYASEGTSQHYSVFHSQAVPYSLWATAGLYRCKYSSLVAVCGNDAIFKKSLTKPNQLTFQESTKPLTGNRTRCSFRTDGKSENNLNRSPILSSSTIIW